MKYILCSVVILIATHYSNGQVTDQDIVRLSLGKNYANLHKTLDSLGVWYALHLDNDQNKSVRGVVDTKKIYSIADGQETVKVWSIILDPKTMSIKEIVINYRHDSRQQVEDSRRLRNFTAIHVGLYSTDIVFQKK